MRDRLIGLVRARSTLMPRDLEKKNKVVYTTLLLLGKNGMPITSNQTEIENSC